jgi:xanthine/CO dehydrogenase XdhC/CoxF family maturation factor
MIDAAAKRKSFLRPCAGRFFEEAIKTIHPHRLGHQRPDPGEIAISIIAELIRVRGEAG